MTRDEEEARRKGFYGTTFVNTGKTLRECEDLQRAHDRGKEWRSWRESEPININYPTGPISDGISWIRIIWAVFVISVAWFFSSNYEPKKEYSATSKPHFRTLYMSLDIRPEPTWKKQLNFHGTLKQGIPADSLSALIENAETKNGFMRLKNVPKHWIEITELYSSKPYHGKPYPFKEVWIDMSDYRDRLRRDVLYN